MTTALTNAEFKKYVDIEKLDGGKIVYRVDGRKIVLHPSLGNQPASMYERVQFNQWVRVTREQLLEIVEDVRHQEYLDHMDELDCGYGLVGS